MTVSNSTSNSWQPQSLRPVHKKSQIFKGQKCTATLQFLGRVWGTRLHRLSSLIHATSRLNYAVHQGLKMHFRLAVMQRSLFHYREGEFPTLTLDGGRESHLSILIHFSFISLEFDTRIDTSAAAENTDKSRIANL